VKPDADRIKAFVEALPRQPWIAGTNRARWPLHLFRIDDVRATASILERGFLYSRNRAIERGLFGHDAASPDVMGNSPEWIKEKVRLYFRPRTPTEYRSEGFRPAAALPMGAHRPMPIVLVFDAVPILVADGTEFTDGNAASSRAERGSTIDFLKQIPLEKVYHVGALTDSEKSDVTFRRCAEVVVQDELDLTHLKYILCRSQAEMQTLLDILPAVTRSAFERRVGISANVHCRSWTFLEAVDMTSEEVTFRFTPSSLTPGPFDALAEFRGLAGNLIGRWSDPAFQARGPHTLTLANIGNPAAYRVTLTLDGALAYSATYKAKEALL
jgi:hypothetical protein